MPNEILINSAVNSLVFSTADYSGTIGPQTDLLTLKGLADGAARQSDLADLDNQHIANKWPRDFSITPVIMWFDLAPPNFGTIDIYWGASFLAGGLPGGLGVSDANYTGSAGSSLAESLKQLQFLGSLFSTEDDDPIIQQTTFRASLPTQHGVLVVVNNTDTAISESTQLGIVLTPIEFEVQ